MIDHNGLIEKTNTILHTVHRTPLYATAYTYAKPSLYPSDVTPITFKS